MDEVKQNSIRAWVLAARPKTLTGAVIPVLIGTALAWSDGRFGLWQALICLAFAMLMQIAANFINDLYDYLRGTDGADRLGPQRACAQGWISPDRMKAGIVVTIALACGLGCLILYFSSPILILVGLACVIFAFLYTTLLSYLGLGDLLVLVFFGLVPVCGTYYVQAGLVTGDAVVASLCSGVVIDLLLIVNNYRDRDTDCVAGKVTLIAKWGEKFGRYDYLITGLVAWALTLILLVHGRVWACVLPLFFIPVHVSTWREMSVIRHGKALNRVLGLTSRNMLFYGLLLAVGLIL